MSAPADRGKPDSVGELRGKSMGELMEILERQEKLLNNSKFIAKLPDRGRKILEYREKLRLAIAEQKRLKKTKDLLSSIALEFQEKQFNTKENSQITSVPQCKAPPVLTLLTESLSSGANTTEPKHTPNLEITRSSIPVSAIQETPKHGSNSAENTVNALVNDLKMINVKDSEKDTSGTSDNWKKNSSSLVGSALPKSRYIDVIERRAKDPVHKNEKFRTNRLASHSDCSSPSQSPGESALRISVEERRIHERKHLNDITAATLPPLHHSPAQLLPLEESLGLQIAQKQSYEEMQAKLAAQKLFEKLNIKGETFNPEGDSYMKYRDQKDEAEE
ncbi:protein GRINL1A [Pseudophryne corroboree]|uniref:protein GRINL1A n=1 Tax=Pseudophryne corroboree TaxID=495146 RepID=UPI0030815CD1